MSVPNRAIFVFSNLAYRGSNIRINYTDTCQIIAVADNSSLGTIVDSMVLYAYGGGESQFNSATLPLNGEVVHFHPTIDWTPNLQQNSESKLGEDSLRVWISLAFRSLPKLLV